MVLLARPFSVIFESLMRREEISNHFKKAIIACIFYEIQKEQIQKLQTGFGFTLVPRRIKEGVPWEHISGLRKEVVIGNSQHGFFFLLT